MLTRTANRILLLLCVLALALSVRPAVAAQALQRDVDYRLISPQPVASGERVEVIEFFFYGCPYCAEFTPLLEDWLSRKPPDVEFRRVPVVRHESWVPLAKTYYTLEALGADKRLHQAVYRGQHEENLALSQEDTVLEWAAKQGLDRHRFLTHYRSAAIRDKVERARQLTLDYEIRATPSVVIDGRFLSSSGMTGGVPRLIPVLDALVELARQHRRAQSGR